jgi:hypothetical protein
MIKVKSWFNGLVKKELQIFFSRPFDHVEIVESTILFGVWTIKEEAREVFIPHADIRDKAQMRVIADALTELHETLKRLEEIE